MKHKFTRILNLRGTPNRPRMEPMLKVSGCPNPVYDWYIKNDYMDKNYCGWINLNNLKVECEFEVLFNNTEKPDYKFHELYKIIYGVDYKYEP